MCVNDVVVLGAEPLFFLDYYASGRLDVDTAAAVVSGIADGCRQAGAALIGGETAELPGMYQGDDYDLAGFCVGIVEKSEVIDGSRVAPGDAIIGLASSGPHSNGYSLIRRIVEISGAELGDPFGETTLGESLLAPTRIYVRPVLEVARALDLRAVAHITGGGLPENLPRVLPQTCGARLRRDSWSMPPIFRWLQEQGNVTDQELLRTFNCGVGMILIVPPESADRAIEILNLQGERAWLAGEIIADRQGVELI
jgi:phosphoribosylformylglycinamidine cyclo-ligase